MEVRARADSGSDQPRVIGCQASDSRSSAAAAHGRSLPTNLAEAVDVSAEWALKEDQNQSHHPDADQTNENETRNQQPTAMLSSPQERSQQENPPGWTRMNQMSATESNRPVYPLLGLDNMTATAEHSNGTTIVAADCPSPIPLSPRISALPRRRASLRTSGTVPLPLENGSTRSVGLDTVSERTEESGPDFASEGGASSSIGYPEALPNASEDATHVAVDSVNRNNMLDFRRTTCRRIQPEPQLERTGLLVGTWYSLTLDPSGVLVSIAVNDVDDQKVKSSIPKLRKLDGLVSGPDDRLDTATDVDVFLARSSDEVHPKHLSPDERADFQTG